MSDRVALHDQLLASPPTVPLSSLSAFVGRNSVQPTAVVHSVSLREASERNVAGVSVTASAVVEGGSTTEHPTAPSRGRQRAASEAHLGCDGGDSSRQSSNGRQGSVGTRSGVVAWGADDVARGAASNGRRPSRQGSVNSSRPASAIRELSREEVVQRSRSLSEYFRGTRAINQSARPPEQTEAILTEARRQRSLSAALRGTEVRVSYEADDPLRPQHGSQRQSSCQRQFDRATTVASSSPRSSPSRTSGQARPPSPLNAGGAKVDPAAAEQPAQLAPAPAVAKAPRKSLLEQFGHGVKPKTDNDLVFLDVRQEERAPERRKSSRGFCEVRAGHTDLLQRLAAAAAVGNATAGGVRGRDNGNRHAAVTAGGGC